MGSVPCFVDPDCMNFGLLTRKNKSNPANISANTRYLNAKKVEANCKKDFALCMGSSSPCKNFFGTFHSGTNWFDYLHWVIDKMDVDLVNKSLNSDSERDESDDDTGDNVESASVTTGGDVTGVGGSAGIVVGGSVDTSVYFKGFIAFALWGYILPTGGDEFKSVIICSVVNDMEGMNQDTSRDSTKKMELDEKKRDRELDKR